MKTHITMACTRLVAALAVLVFAGSATAAHNAQIGLHFQPQATGLYIQAVDPHSPAARAGLAAGNAIVTVNGTHTTTASQLQQRLQGAATAQVLVLAGGTLQMKSLHMATLTPPALAGTWRTNLGGYATLTCVPNSSDLTGIVRTPLYPDSFIQLTVQANGIIKFSYSRRDGADYGNGELRMIGSNKLEGYFKNARGATVPFRLTQ